MFMNDRRKFEFGRRKKLILEILSQSLGKKNPLELKISFLGA